jgi:hypothetical protein
MPHRSRKTHNWLALIGGAFAFLLIVSSLLISNRQAGGPVSVQKNGSAPTSTGEGLVAGPAQDLATAQNSDAVQSSIDTSSWKNYRDPLYHFEIRYPSEWAAPVAKKITDPDFDYEYQVSFGTADTISGSGTEGFTVYVFPTDKCGSDKSGVSNCATKISQVPTGITAQPQIFEFSSEIYSYTVVPFIAESNADQSEIKKINQIIDEAQKTFSLDPNLKTVQNAKSQNSAAQSLQTQPIAKPPVRVGRAGKITGGVPVGGGRYICPHPNRKPARSKIHKWGLPDEDCCPDPDEYPNIACIYKPSDYAILIH